MDKNIANRPVNTYYLLITTLCKITTVVTILNYMVGQEYTIHLTCIVLPHTG